MNRRRLHRGHFTPAGRRRPCRHRHSAPVPRVPERLPRSSRRSAARYVASRVSAADRVVQRAPNISSCSSGVIVIPHRSCLDSPVDWPPPWQSARFALLKSRPAQPGSVRDRVSVDGSSVVDQCPGARNQYPPLRRASPDAAQSPGGSRPRGLSRANSAVAVAGGPTARGGRPAHGSATFSGELHAEHGLRRSGPAG